MIPVLRELRDFFVSLKLTIVLLALSMVLVLAATLAQVDLGVWAVQHEFFRSIVAFWHVGKLIIPLPGGYLVGGLLLINLIAAHVYRFKLSWRKLGIIIAHFGLILLLVGELLTGLWQEEFNLRISEGETRNYAESYQHVELAITDVTDAAFDDVVAIPEALLARHELVQHPKLPFRVVPKAFYPNAALVMRQATPPAGGADEPQATQGIGQRIQAVPQPITYKQDDRNVPAALVELSGPQGSLGTWMVSAQIPSPQHFEYGGRSWKITLRFQRAYKPFSLTLLKFSHDVYPGTDIPKNFSSRVRLTSTDDQNGREILIYMNNPLRYAGLTFYQSGFDGEHTTILQVVRNPSWLIPYIACSLIAAGLVFQFGFHLFGFFGRRRDRAGKTSDAGGASEVGAGSDVGSASRVGGASEVRSGSEVGAGSEVGGALRPDAPDSPARATPPTTRAPLIPWLILAAGLAILVVALLPYREPTAFHVGDFGRLPVLANGRFKPLDTVARSSLLQLQNRQDVREPNVTEPLVASPTEWLLDVAYRPEKADTYRTFVVDNPDLLTLIGKNEDSLRIPYTGTARKILSIVGFIPSRYRRFSFREIEPHLGAIEEQARLADQVDSGLRNAFQRSVLQLYHSLLQYQRLRHSFVMPGAENFLGELLQLQEKLPEGIAAVRAKQAGDPHDEALVKRVVDLGQRFSVMASASNLLIIPPDRADPDQSHWQTTGAALLDTFQTGRVNPSALAYAGLGRAWRDQDDTRFNELLRLFRADLQKRYGAQLGKSDAETRFNTAEPFYRATMLYGLAFALGLASWLFWPRSLGQSAYWLLILAWLATTAGIATRMWLEGRPPVTNLYSSALFVGWGAVALCLILEYTFRNAIGTVAGSMIGFATLIIAHMLSLTGDTLEMMRAVLDSNFWLATHVVVVTLGYASTFLAGFLALIYIVMGVTTRWLTQSPASDVGRGLPTPPPPSEVGPDLRAGRSADSAQDTRPNPPSSARALEVSSAHVGRGLPTPPPSSSSAKADTNAKILERMVYGIVCFATLFSFTGTVLGGIWADQSWGRFWGWDPKENGALIIVVWNAIILHARWAGLARQRGLMMLAIFGNIVTSWSWFGTNMLGVGLHSYGFTDAAFWALTVFIASQLALIALALKPQPTWRSFQTAEPVTP